MFFWGTSWVLITTVYYISPPQNSFVSFYARRSLKSQDKTENTLINSARGHYVELETKCNARRNMTHFQMQWYEQNVNKTYTFIREARCKRTPTAVHFCDGNPVFVSCFFFLSDVFELISEQSRGCPRYACAWPDSSTLGKYWEIFPLVQMRPPCIRCYGGNLNGERKYPQL